MRRLIRCETASRKRAQRRATRMVKSKTNPAFLARCLPRSLRPRRWRCGTLDGPKKRPLSIQNTAHKTAAANAHCCAKTDGARVDLPHDIGDLGRHQEYPHRMSWPGVIRALVALLFGTAIGVCAYTFGSARGY